MVLFDLNSKERIPKKRLKKIKKVYHMINQVNDSLGLIDKQIYDGHLKKEWIDNEINYSK